MSHELPSFLIDAGELLQQAGTLIGICLEECSKSTLC